MNMQAPISPEEITQALGLDPRAKARRWTKRLVYGLLAAFAVGAIGYWYYSSGATAKAVTYDTTPVVQSPLTVTVTATGTIQPTTQVDVSSEISGVIRAVNVDANSLVKKGDVLAALDVKRLEAQLGRARASLASSEAKLLNARATYQQNRLAYERQVALSKKGFAANQDLDSALAARDSAAATVAAAEADIEVAKADIALQEIDIAKSSVLSPVDGIVLKRAAEPGQTVASSFQAPVLFTLAQDLKRMQVEANIDEADIGMVKAGQDAQFTVDAYPGRTFPARIETLEFSPLTTDGVVTYKAVLTVDNGDLLLRPGMTATAQIIVQKVDNTLAVPNAALRYQPQQQRTESGFDLSRIFFPRPQRGRGTPKRDTQANSRSVWILENGRPHEVEVTTGVSDGKLTQITGGKLTTDDEVITASRRSGS
ncbi:efflux RND transporter periplasmic adaptor subunit [Taklimakanibacter lacteus]|uniref:efflux RND transporter periplasmic adaptor subunit n=1 Tax=Taklimakanibacter lacteus TaxID=2268456 RepID=UPI000E674EEA